MNAGRSKMLWPFGQRAAVVSVPIIVVVGFALVGVVRQLTGWPGASGETVVLTGLLIVALTPVGLTVIDVIASRGGTFEYVGLLKISFAAAVADRSMATVPANIGVRGVPVKDHNSHDIVSTLRSAVSSAVVIVDLEDGNAWWETRLLVLCAGAARRGRPEIIVFTATEAENPNLFKGWSKPRLLSESLMNANPAYRDSYFRARSAARQWELVVDSATSPQPLASLTGLAASLWVLGGAPASAHGFLLEQFLALDLGEKIEKPDMPGVTTVQLQALFGPVLHTNQVDDDASGAERLAAFLRSTDPHIAVTKHGRYEGLMEHSAGVNAILKQILDDSGRATTKPIESH